MNNRFWYLATPYSRYPEGIEAAFIMACRAVADFLRLGIPVYSPIAHTHPVAIYGELDPLDHSIWLPADEPMMRAACGLIVWCAEGWKDSKGIAHEIAIFEEAGLPVLEIAPGAISPGTANLLLSFCSPQVSA